MYLSEGPDPLAASEARARGASPARGRTHHIHIQQEPDFIPSMTFRLNVARDLLERANRTIDRLENPNSAEPPPTSTSSNSTSNGVGMAGISSPMMGDMSSQFAQVIQSAVNNAMMHGGHGGRSMNFEMSVQIAGPNGQMFAAQVPRTTATSSSLPSASSTSTTSSSFTQSTTTSSSSSSGTQTSTESDTTTTTSESGASAQAPRSGNSGNQRQPLQHPPLSAMGEFSTLSFPKNF